jgi:hypothetical protein
MRSAGLFFFIGLARELIIDGWFSCGGWHGFFVAKVGLLKANSHQLHVERK